MQTTRENKFPHFCNALAGESFLSMSGSGPVVCWNKKVPLRPFGKVLYEGPFGNLAADLLLAASRASSHALTLAVCLSSATRPPGGPPGPLSLGNGQCFPLLRKVHSVRTFFFPSLPPKSATYFSGNWKYVD